LFSPQKREPLGTYQQPARGLFAVVYGGATRHRSVQKQQGLDTPKRQVSWELRVAPMQAMPSPMGHSPMTAGHSRQSQLLPTGFTDSRSE